MGIVGTGFSMSLDGFVAGPNDDVSQVFAWIGKGDTEYRAPGGRVAFKVAAASAALIQAQVETTGAVVVGRRHFDGPDGWNGRHPMDVPVFVVTHALPQAWSDAHPDAPFTFVTNGVESAIVQARAIAGDKNVGIGGPNVARQAIAAGLVDEIGIDLVPVLLGQGVRYFERLGLEPMQLERLSVVEGIGVTHLRFRIIKDAKATMSRKGAV